MWHEPRQNFGAGQWLVAGGQAFHGILPICYGKIACTTLQQLPHNGGVSYGACMHAMCMRSDAKILVREMLHNASGARDAKTVGSSSKHAQ
jgi:hypothetical protein